jgi:hypothetical protein
MEPIIADMRWGLKSPRFPPNLPPEAAATHIGFAFGWAIRRNLINEEFTAMFTSELVGFRELRLTGPQMLVRLGGIIQADWLDIDAAAFLAAYCRKAGRYIHDYVQSFPAEVYQSRSMYAVPDTWQNMEKVLPLLDSRFNAWKLYPPAARSIFNPKTVAVSAYNPLELVVPAAVVPLARKLSQRRRGAPTAAMIVPSSVRTKEQLSYCLDPADAPVVNEDVDGTLEHLRGRLIQGTACAFAVASLKTEPAHMLRCIEVIAQHQQSGPHRIWSPYTVASDGRIVFEQPVVCVAANQAQDGT